MKKLSLLMLLTVVLAVGCAPAHPDIATDLGENQVQMTVESTTQETVAHRYKGTKERVFTSLEIGLTQDELPSVATLFYNEGVKLSHMGYEVVIDDNVLESDISYDEKTFPYIKSYDMEYEPNHQLLMVHNKTMGMNGTLTRTFLFRMDGGEPKEIWRSDALGLRIADIQLEDKKAIFEVGETGHKIGLRMTGEEVEEGKAIVKDLNLNQIRVDEAFMDSIANNVAISYKESVLLDHDSDGALELLLLADIETVGAKTPLVVSESAVIILDIDPQMVQVKEVVFERQTGSGILFAYFENKVSMIMSQTYN